MIPPRPPITVVKLSDHGGQYVLTLKCECDHMRTAQPQTLAALAGWDAPPVDVVRRLRCSRCDTRRCSAKVRHETKRDGNVTLFYLLHADTVSMRGGRISLTLRLVISGVKS